jgi:hypothetical protein
MSKEVVVAKSELLSHQLPESSECNNEKPTWMVRLLEKIWTWDLQDRKQGYPTTLHVPWGIS